MLNRVNIRPLTDEEGGGWLATFPDLPGCMSDGETKEEALQNAADAEALWLEANQEWEVKEPGLLNWMQDCLVHCIKIYKQERKSKASV